LRSAADRGHFARLLVRDRVDADTRLDVVDPAIADLERRRGRRLGVRARRRHLQADETRNVRSARVLTAFILHLQTERAWIGTLASIILTHGMPRPLIRSKKGARNDGIAFRTLARTRPPGDKAVTSDPNGY
jgi:hypothetical protein